MHIKNSSGFSLVEVLVSVVVIAVGLLGLTSMELISLKYNDSAYARSKANIFAYDMLDRLRSNKSAAMAEEYDQLSLADAAQFTQPSGSAPIATQDRYQWYTQLANEKALHAGKASIDCDTSAICNIVIQWDDSVAAGASSVVSIAVAAQL